MPYKKLIGRTIGEYRQIFIKTYCDKDHPIKTFDGIIVQFYPNMFEHSFYESANWKKKDKSIFSVNRAEKVMWIKDVLEDKTADLRCGWNKKKKSYQKVRRVAIVKNNYVVIIQIFDELKARFITAYEADKSITKILSSPKWEGLK